MTKCGWCSIPNRAGVVFDGDGFYVSYNPELWRTGRTNSAGGGRETALVVSVSGEDRKRFYILNGDFRKEYEDVIDKGLDACMEVFKRFKPTYVSDCSHGEE